MNVKSKKLKESEMVNGAPGDQRSSHLPAHGIVGAYQGPADMSSEVGISEGHNKASVKESTREPGDTEDIYKHIYQNEPLWTSTLA